MSNLNEQTILVEKHYIPVSIYQQIYTNHHQNAVPIATNTTRATNIPPMNIFGNGQPRTSNSTVSNGNTTIRTTRRTTFSTLNPHNLNNSDNSTTRMTNGTNQTGSDTNNLDEQEATNQGRNTTGTGSSRIQIEALASGDDNDINLFNALFAALINPSRLDGTNSNTDRPTGLTANQIEDNSTVITYNNQPDNSAPDNQPSSTICSICTLEYEPQQQVRCLDACDHAFHTGCIDRWLAAHNTCPLCRSQVLPRTNNSSSSRQTSSSRTHTASINLNGLD